MEVPRCQKCNDGTLIPLSDCGQEGASVIFNAWACTNPACGFSLAWANRDGPRTVSTKDRRPAELDDVVEALKDAECAVDNVVSALESGAEELKSFVEESTEAMTKVTTDIVKAVKRGFFVIAVLLLPVVIRACQQLR